MKEITAKEARQRAKWHTNDGYAECMIHNACHSIRNVAVEGGHGVLVKRSSREGIDEQFLAKMDELGFDVSEANGKFLVQW